MNTPVIEAIAHDHPAIPIQVGGGIRDAETIARYLAAGVRYLILGTKAVSDPESITLFCKQFPGHLLVGLGAKEVRVAVEGWSQYALHSPIDLACALAGAGVGAIIYTDIGRDGMMTGVNVEATVALARSIKIPVIASGCIRHLEDIHALCAVSRYEGTLDFVVGQRLADELTA